jgi:CBS domain-containing protein
MPSEDPTTSLTVEHVMHPGVIDCPPQTPLREVAGLMADMKVHCVVVDGLHRGPHGGEQLVWGIVSDVDLMRATAAGGLEEEAGAAATTEIVTIDLGADVREAAQMMAEHECPHLLVTGPDGRPRGVISSLDVARAIVRPVGSVA